MFPNVNQIHVCWQESCRKISQNDSPTRLEVFHSFIIGSLAARCFPLLFRRVGPIRVLDLGKDEKIHAYPTKFQAISRVKGVTVYNYNGFHTTCTHICSRQHQM